MGFTASPASVWLAIVVLVLAPTSIGGEAGRDDPEANAGAKLAAFMSTRGARIRNAAAAQQAFIEEYCAGCHNSSDVAGSLDLSIYSTADPGAEPAVWETVARKIRGGMMPPADSPQPPAAHAVAFAASIEQALDRHARANFRLAPTTMARLNRTEYANAVRDVLALQVDAAALLPPDDSEEGFDNIAEMLVMSPALVDGYVSAAMRISREAVGDLEMEPVRVAMRNAGHTDGLPLGARGGLVGEYFFPLDASYEITIASAAAGGGRGGGPGAFGGAPAPPSGPTARLVVILDGKPLQVENPSRFTLKLAAGPHTIGAALIDLARPGNVEGIYSGRNDAGGVTGITVSGPNAVTGRGNTPSRARLFTCRPASPAEEPACATRILAQLATRAYRRPVETSDADMLQPLLAAYQDGRRRGDFDLGIQYGVARVLVDPRFLFRLEADPPRAIAGRAYQVSDIELASRLSFFLWSSVPDEPLLEVAAAGRLSRPAELRRQVRRMLADPRSQALALGFAEQWLKLRDLAASMPDDPAFDNSLRRAMSEETRLLFGSILQEDRPVTSLLDADYTFLNDRLARHYGIEGIRGPQMRKVSLPADSPRRGLLGQASVLTVTSVADRTSPVTRGKWVLESLLGLPVPKPPPGVETNLDASVHIEGPTTLRTRLEAHRDKPACRNCHALIDPIGYALEPFDKIGRLRTEDGGLPIDARGTMVDGTALNGPDDLRKALVDNTDVFVVAFTGKLMTYALGRTVTHADQPTIRDIVRRSRADQYKLTSLVMNIIESVPFRQRVATGNDTVARNP
jgi:hypothetical protein